jgi:hypothetical protein
LGAARATVKGRAAGAMRWLALTEDGDGPIVDLMGPIEFEFEFAFELWALVDEIDEIDEIETAAVAAPPLAAAAAAAAERPFVSTHSVICGGRQRPRTSAWERK